jgi:NAD(P)-dependent dehydrogenase (short-subunit alcohol dehydrogenase family)
MSLSAKLEKLTNDLTNIIKELDESSNTIDEKRIDTATPDENKSDKNKSDKSTSDKSTFDKKTFDILSEHAKYVIPLSAKLNSMLRKSTNRPHIDEYEKYSKKTNNTKRIGCYSCKVGLWRDDMRHKVYTNMCWLCGNINFSKRDFKKDLSGKVAIVTGGRVKIGYETAIRLLKNNCKVIVTSRFVDDCLERYEKHSDFDKFKNNLYIYQLNMLDGGNIEKFIQYVFDNFSQIDYLINNAAQTIKRPKEFFVHLIEKSEKSDSKENSKMIVHRDNNELKLLDSNNTLLLNYKSDEISNLFPINEFDQFGQQIDLRTENSWMLEAEHVDISELAEVYIINSIGPYILSTRLKPLMTKKNGFSWIINVTSMEGVFNWDRKPSRHPHTNMAKAALNMFTRTSGQHYINSKIIMVCVDTGWNNPQQPNSYDVETPVDCADGASRILDPIYRELKTHSVMYKNYEVHPW